MNPYEFEQKIKRYIKDSGRSQAATARKLGTSPDTFNKWVRGVNQMPIDIFHRFCELLQLAEDQHDELFVLAGHVVTPIIAEIPPVTQTATEEVDSLPTPPLPEKLFRDLVGRDEILSDMLKALGDPAGKRILAVDGMGGIGKTALAAKQWIAA